MRGFVQVPCDGYTTAIKGCNQEGGTSTEAHARTLLYLQMSEKKKKLCKHWRKVSL